MSKELKVDARILRNEIVRKAAVANMTNIAKQREDLKQGIIPIPPERKSATEIAEDRTVQAGDALKNLIDLGFKDSDALAISSDLTHEQRVAFNRAYPQIQNDFSSRFSVRNSTPEFFIEYLKNYLKILKATGGIPNSIGYLQDNLITTPTDLLKLILTSENIERLTDLLTAEYGLTPLDGLNAVLTDLINVLPNTNVITDLNQVMITDPVLGFESIQDIMALVSPLPSQKVIKKILDAPHSNAAQRTQIRLDLLSKLDVLEPVAFRNLPTIYRDLAASVAAAVAPAPIGAPAPAPAPIGAPAPAPRTPTPPPIATPLGTPITTPLGTPPATPSSAVGLAPPKRTKRFSLLLMANYTNSANGIDYDVYMYNYTDPPKGGNKFFALILDPTASGASSSSSSASPVINLWGIDGSEMATFFAQFRSEIDISSGGTSFNISAMGAINTSSLDALLTRASRDSTNYNSRTFSKSEIDAMQFEQYEPSKVGFGIKKRPKTTPAKKQTGLKPIRLGKGFKNRDDPYTMYDEELKLTPISASDVIKKPPKKQAHKVSEGIDGDDYQKFDDKANRYIAFGKYAVNMRQLKKAVLQIVYKSLAPNPSFPSKKISSELQQYLFELLTNQKSLPALYKHVPEEEKKMFEKLAIFAGVFDKLNLPRINSLEDEKKEMDRFKLLHGEFIAGNDNVSIIRELRNLILKFLADNRISKAKAYEYLLELNNA
jgi:hypothetical protein